jgi:SAM-dependent methyltransferase
MEHVGLGRYGDNVDPNGCFGGIRELQRVLAPGGRLYFSVPIGHERVEFDAHRVLAPETVLQSFDELTLREFSVIDDSGRLLEYASASNFSGADYACGLFLFERKR